MSGGEKYDKSNQKKFYQPYRPAYSGRGRGGFNSHANKALQELGVRDLREWLDKKHQGQEKKLGGPPSDPYNYLKDPSREDFNRNKQNQGYHKEPQARHFSARPHISRGRGWGNRNQNPEYSRSFIHDPVNIRVELTTTTGERNYTIDEHTKLADIKHVPDHPPLERRYFRGKTGRGRDNKGRGRGHGRGRYNLNSDKNQIKSNYNLVNSYPQNSATCDSSEENWDLEIANSAPLQNIENKKIEEKFEGEENLEEETDETYEQAEEYLGEQEYFHEEYDEHVDDYSESEEYHEKDFIESRDLLEEGLVVTSSVTQNKEGAEKRVVRFKLEENHAKREDSVSTSLEDITKTTNELDDIVKGLEKTDLNENIKETLKYEDNKKK